MLVSLKWLKELVDVDLPVPELVDRLDLTGTAVEAVHVAGRRSRRRRRPDRHEGAPPRGGQAVGDTVDVGADEPLQIVCGAQNFEAGDKVPVALVGATLPNGMTIKKAKLRGVESRGHELLARASSASGRTTRACMILPADAPVGMPFAEYHGLADTILELEITPNRPDCLSVAGVAREVGAVLETSASVPASTPEESGEPAADFGDRDHRTIAELCPRYTARLIRGVQDRAVAGVARRARRRPGARSINNVVDITNYVMFELGQPLHAFDANLLARDGGGRIVVGVRARGRARRSRTLDGQERALTTDMLLITDPTGPIALAGVMGGEGTEVSDRPWTSCSNPRAFDPGSVSRTSRRLGLFSEASSRFETCRSDRLLRPRSTARPLSWPSSPAARWRRASLTPTRAPRAAHPDLRDRPRRGRHRSRCAS